MGLHIQEKEIMETPIFPLFYFPPIVYFSYLNQYDEIHIEMYENYIKQTYRNRCYILGPNGKQTLSFPIQHRKNKTINDTYISYESKWKSEHIRSIETAYNNAPYFIYYWDKYKNILNKKNEKLSTLNMKILEENIKDLNIQTKINFTNEYTPQVRHDFRNEFNAKKEYKKDFPIYQQVFIDKLGFQKNLSILDLIFNLGPEAGLYIKDNYIK